MKSNPLPNPATPTPVLDIRRIGTSYGSEVQNHPLAHYYFSNRNVIAVSSVAYHIFEIPMIFKTIACDYASKRFSM